MNREEINKEIHEKVFGETWPVQETRYAIILTGFYNQRQTGCKTKEEAERKAAKHPLHLGAVVEPYKWPKNITTPDYFSLKGCMKLFLKIQEKEWYGEFRHKQATLNDCALGNEVVRGFQRCERLVHPDRLAPAVYDFIKENDLC